MRILVFGASGMLGHKVIQRLSKEAELWGTLRGVDRGFGRFEILPEERIISGIDASSETSIRRALEKCRPEIVINAVGIVKQLPSSKDVITTLTINSIFPHRLAALSDEYNYRLFTISTDCVFDGEKGKYTEDDRPDATDLYGKSKHLGEVTDGRSLTLRTSIIGREIGTHHSLVEWFLSNRGGTVKGFRSAIYSGFPTIVLAGIIRDLIFGHPKLSGLYHVSSEPINKFELLNLIKKHYDMRVEIVPDDDFRIDRSLDSTRFREATGFQPEDWDSMIAKMASDPTPYGEWQ